MKIQIDGHLIDTEMIVAVTKPSYSDHEFEIMLLGRQTITIKRTKHQDMYRHITTDMQARMTPEERIKDGQESMALQIKRDNKRESEKRAIDAMYNKLLEIWEPSTKYLNITVE